jgi:hypothetical protein
MVAGVVEEVLLAHRAQALAVPVDQVAAVLDLAEPALQTTLGLAQLGKVLLVDLPELHMGLLHIMAAVVVGALAVLVLLQPLGLLLVFFTQFREMAAWVVKSQSAALQRLMAAAVGLVQTTNHQVSKSLSYQAEAELAMGRLLRMDRRVAFPALR